MRLLTLAAIAILGMVIASAPAPLLAKDAKSLSLQQMKQKASPRQAMDLHRKIQKQRLSRSQVSRMQKSAGRMRTQLRSAQPSAEDQEWASLLAPENYCVDLVRKVCGVTKQCGGSGSCAMTIQFLELYNAESDPAEKSGIEDSCVATLSDHTVFPACP